jgi:hypothetical protein
MTFTGKNLVLFAIIAWWICHRSILGGVSTEAPFQSTAASDTSANLEASGNFWAFQPITREPPVPKVKGRFWISNPIDNFILAKLEEKQLSPAQAADGRTLIRRATFDLTGLPPTPEEIAAFLADKSTDAFAKVVDRLLASPQYGERWGRHWLDVARYADSNGLDENVAHGNAWRYRDYVVGSFNRDKPFDQFLIEQLAGDLLPASDNFAVRQERLIATGFLSLGPKVLAEPDPKKMEMDIIDEQIDTVGRAFMGLTLGCARCHDHKFDPIPIEDYYSLAGIFKSTRTMDNYKIVAEWHENSLATPAELAAKAFHDKNVTDQKASLTNWINQVNLDLAAEARRRVTDYLVAATAIKGTGSPSEVGKAATDASLNAGFLKQWHAYLSKTTTDTNSIFYGAFPIGATNSTSPAVGQFLEGSDYSTPRELAELYAALFSEAERAAEGCTSNSLSNVKLEAARKVLIDPKGPFALPARIETFYPAPIAAELKRKRETVAGLEQKSPELPTTMGVEEGAVTQKIAVHIRGSHLALGPEVSKQFPRVLSKHCHAAIGDKESGRLQLAQWLASKDHPLTSRVMVNRIWRWHFGQGLVPTVDNFGKLGERPLNQPLLDWLAARFVKDGWSIKALHRVIMLSSTYRMSSATDSSTMQMDSENRLLSRMNVRRLEAEAIRDSLLAVSGAFDLSMGGKVLQLKNREFVFNHTSKDATRYEGYRRSLYQPIIRNHLYDVFDLFDFPDPAIETGDRAATTIAPQALFMMNSDFVLEAASHLAAELLRNEALPDTERVERAYIKSYGRPPTASETARALGFLERSEAQLAGSVSAQSERRLRSWQDLCQVILASNEFVYVK